MSGNAAEYLASREDWNRCRYRAGSDAGHYESYFQRANHPSRPLAFWIRYTIFSPRARPQDAIGELWAVYFDGESGAITAAKDETAIANCSFSTSRLDARIGAAWIRDGELCGAATGKRGADAGDHRAGAPAGGESDAPARAGAVTAGAAPAGACNSIAWDLRYSGSEPPLPMLPLHLYDRGFPKAKAVVGLPNAVYRGALAVNGKQVSIDGWAGSQNHNWGSRHTDSYAWGQVAGFDNDPQAFLECATSRVKIGPFWTPWFTLMVLRLGGEEIALNSLGQALRAYGRYDYFDWRMESQALDLRLGVKIAAPASAFVGLRYYNPPGGDKVCLNSKIAGCTLTLERKGVTTVLETDHRAAFEILTDDRRHGVAVAA